MVCYRVEWKDSALKELRGIEPGVIQRIVSAVEELRAEPRPRGCRKLAGGSSTYRIRIGRYRVLYTIEDDRLTIQIVRVGHRSGVYRSRS